MGPPGQPTGAKRVAIAHGILSATEGHMKRHIDRLIHSLVMIRLGQELGTDSQAARAIHDVLELLAKAAGIFSG